MQAFGSGYKSRMKLYTGWVTQVWMTADWRKVFPENRKLAKVRRMRCELGGCGSGRVPASQGHQESRKDGTRIEKKTVDRLESCGVKTTTKNIDRTRTYCTEGMARPLTYIMGENSEAVSRQTYSTSWQTVTHTRVYKKKARTREKLGNFYRESTEDKKKNSSMNQAHEADVYPEWVEPHEEKKNPY